MYHKRMMKDQYQLSMSKNGHTGKVTNTEDLNATIDMFTKAITKLFHAGKAVNFAIISEDGNISKIEVDIYTAAEF